jgi:hypothetical protein
MTVSRLIKSCFALLLASMASPTFSQGMGGFAASPALIRSPVLANKVGTLRIDLENFEATPLTATVRVLSVKPDNGSYAMQLGVKHPNDASGWFKAPEQKITVARDQKYTIQLPFKAPTIKPGAYWCTVEIAPTFAGRRANMILQVPVFFYAGRPMRPNLKIGTPGLAINGRKQRITVPLENAGDGLLTVVVRADIRDAGSGRVLQRLQDVDRDLYPHTNRVLALNLNPLKDGNYIISATTQLGLRNFSPMQQAVRVQGGKVSVLSPAEVKELSNLTFVPAAILEDKGTPGARRTKTVQVLNGTGQQVTVNLTLGGLTQQPNGSYQLTESPPKGVNVSISPTEVTIPARGSRTIKIVMEVPKDAKGDTWFGIEAEAKGTRMMAEQMIGRVTVPSTAMPGLALKSLGLEKINGRPTSMSFEIRNTGNAAISPAGEAHILLNGITPINEADPEVPILGDGGILPGAQLTNKVQIPLSLKPGTYLLSVVYQYSDTQFDRITERFTVTPPPKKAPVKTNSKPASKKKKGGRNG